MLLPKVSVRGKILATVFAVAAVVLAVGAYSAINAVRVTLARGRYLEKNYVRFRQVLDEAAVGQFAVARLLASDPGLGAALSGGDAATVSGEAKRLAEGLQGSFAPDLLVVSDASGVTVGGLGFGTLPTGAWRGTRLFQDLRDGRTVRGNLAEIERKGYRVAGAPVRGATGVVGAVLVGVRLDRVLKDFAENSGTSEPALQQRVSLLGHDHVLASSLPEGEWPKLFEAVRNPASVDEGDTVIPVIRLGGVVFDFVSEPVRGYDGAADPATHELGTFYMIRARADSSRYLRAAYTSISLTYAIALLLALGVGYLLAVQITRPLKRYIEATSDLARGRGDLGQRLEVHTRDELGVLADNLNRVFARIHSLAASVQRSAFQVNASSGEISTVSKQMLDGAKEQAGKITNSTAAVTELSSSIQQVAENAAEASRRAKAGGEAVTRAIQRLSQIRRTVEDAASRIATLGESGKRIGNIVEVIRQISEQTTMLALNAAIEAAHAGEHGRGFAVVADEVSSLAKRTGQSARDIEDLIATIRDQTGEAVRTMQDGSHEVEEGTGLVEATLADFKTLVSVIDDTASAVQEQAIASDEIARNMDAVQRIANAVLGSSENAVVEGDRLQKLADELEESVRGFRIDPERVALDEATMKALTEGRS